MKSLRLTEEQLAAIQQRAAHAPKTSAKTLGPSGQPVKKPSKYRNKPTMIMGRHGEYIEFPSRHEAERYQQLCLLEDAGRIRNLRLQVKYHFDLNDVHICDYIADFKYEEFMGGETWVVVVEDAKGMATKEFRIKRKLMRAFHGVTVRLV